MNKIKTKDKVKPAREHNVADNKKPTIWRMFIYMAADNNLKEECVYALTEILKVGATQQCGSGR